MNNMGNGIIIFGLVLVILGLGVMGKLGPIGKLPGDISIQRPGFSFYFPLATSIVISLVFSLFFWLFRK